MKKGEINPQIKKIIIPILLLVILIQGIWITGLNKSKEVSYDSYLSSPKSFTHTSILTITPEHIDYSIFTVTKDNQSIAHPSTKTIIVLDSLYPLSHRGYLSRNGKDYPHEYFNYSINVQIIEASLNDNISLTIFYDEKIESRTNDSELVIDLIHTLINSSNSEFSLTNQSTDLGFYYTTINETHYINLRSYDYCVRFKAIPTGYYGIQLKNKNIYSDFNSTITLKITIKSFEDNTFHRWAVNSFLDDIYVTETITVTTTVTRKP